MLVTETTVLRFHEILGEEALIHGTSGGIEVCFISYDALAAQVCPAVVEPCS